MFFLYSYKRRCFHDFLFAFVDSFFISFKIGSTLIGRNLLIRRQILSFQNWLTFRRYSEMKTEELHPLKMYPFTLIAILVSWIEIHV